ncbi:2-oxoacid:acceptor oxidoreductase family protein, partial [bacterium]|nr:2-oxoacid:acceptor oxidoreductase family protein [bacterium]
MVDFRKMVDSQPGSQFILQGNIAFALGVAHAGYHAVDGYPGTPSTEVIDKGLRHIQDRLRVGWSVNEAVATEVAVGHVLAGSDTVVTMKIPGMFQAGDAITTAAFYTAPAGAFVIYAATDYVPSSTQHVIDARYFLSASRVPVIEPRNHQEMYDAAFIAADMSREFNTQVVILASGILGHSEGLVTVRNSRTVEPRPLPENLNRWMLMPKIARDNYNKATTERVPGVMKWAERSSMVTEEKGRDKFGVLVVGESDIIVREALSRMNLNPSILSMSIAYPIPENRIKKFAEKIDGPLFVLEDGDTFLQDGVSLLGIEVIGKEKLTTITDWNPEMVMELFAPHLSITLPTISVPTLPVSAVGRPPSICPGCPYRAFALAVAKFKKQGKIYASFGEIGCSTLLFFMNGIDTVLCMGASDPMRQGFVLSRPDMAHKVISVIGDSCEAHSGLDGTRNAIFRNTPGVKVILDNSITAMTGGQPAPSSAENLAGQANKFSIAKSEEAEGARAVVVDSYNVKKVESQLKEALELAEKGVFTTLILEGACIHEQPKAKKTPRLIVDYDKCKACGLCDICVGIKMDDKNQPHFTSLCTNCGGESPVCMQRCPFGAIQFESDKKKVKYDLPARAKEIPNVTVDKDKLPESLRVAIRGIGGQGNLFFGKVLSEVALHTPYAEANIVKGDTHGMAQMGGSVISTFSCGNVHSPILAPASCDVLVVMEASEVLRDGFLKMLKPGGTIVLNKFTVLPPTAKKEDYPDLQAIIDSLKEYTVITIDAMQIVKDAGDVFGKTANVAA